MRGLKIEKVEDYQKTCYARVNLKTTMTSQKVCAVLFQTTLAWVVEKDRLVGWGLIGR